MNFDRSHQNSNFCQPNRIIIINIEFSLGSLQVENQSMVLVYNSSFMILEQIWNWNQYQMWPEALT